MRDATLISLTVKDLRESLDVLRDRVGALQAQIDHVTAKLVARF